MAYSELTVSAYKSLGIDPLKVQSQPQITPMLKDIAKEIDITSSVRTWMKFLETSSDMDAQAIIESYRSITLKHSDKLTIEAFCLAANVPTSRALELITASIVRSGAQASTIIAAAMHPKVVKKTIDMALTDDGFNDRQTLHKATGFLPSPKGSQTNINVTQNANPQVAVAHVPSPESTIRRLADRFNADKMITIPAPVAQLEEENDEE